MEDIKLTPSLNGAECIGNGEHDGIEIQCDECNHYLDCFPAALPRKENNNDNTN